MLRANGAAGAARSRLTIPALYGMTVHFARCRDRIDIRSGPRNSEVCVRRPAGWAGRRQLLILVCGQGVPQVSVVDMAGTDGQGCRDVSVWPDQIESSGLQSAFLIGGEVMRAFDPGGQVGPCGLGAEGVQLPGQCAQWHVIAGYGRQPDADGVPGKSRTRL
jgi:hypothetical protein